jgi:D-alanine-D-alanine ligase
MSSLARTRVAVLFGGRSSEHSISCISARCVIEAMGTEGFDIVAIGISRSGSWVRIADPLAALSGTALPEVVEPEVPEPHPGPVTELAEVDVVFPLLHGPYGEDGTIQGLLEVTGHRYVGSGVLASAAAMDKIVMKTLLAAAGLPVGPWEPVTATQWRAEPDLVLARLRGLGATLFVKPSRGGSSLGITRTTTEAEIGPALETALGFDSRVIVEAAVPGREIECGVLADPTPQASVPGEIEVSGEAFYDFETKYLSEAARLVVPADLPEATNQRVRRMALTAFESLGCEGLARVDFFVDGEDIVVNEVNTMPGFTPASMFPLLWQHSGVDYATLVQRLIHAALARPLTVLR